MSIVVTIDKEKDLITRTLTGQFPIEDVIRELQETAKHPDYHPGMKSLNDLREFVPVSDSSNVRRMAEYLLANAAEREGLRAAIVVSRTVDYGMARMLQALADTPSFSLAVFYDLDEAKQWLGVE
jgi:hypothetical protein